MKVKVLERFRDKHTLEIYEAGKVMNMTEKRFKEILAVGQLVEEVIEQNEAEEAPKKKRTKKAEE